MRVRKLCHLLPGPYLHGGMKDKSVNKTTINHGKGWRGKLSGSWEGAVGTPHVLVCDPRQLRRRNNIEAEVKEGQYVV